MALPSKAPGSKAPSERPQHGPGRAEIAAFTERLKGLSLDKLRTQLAGPAVGPKWKRELAEDEMEQRSAEEDEASEAPGVSVAAARRKSTPTWGRWVAAVLIAGSCAVMLYTAYLVWAM